MLINILESLHLQFRQSSLVMAHVVKTTTLGKWSVQKEKESIKFINKSIKSTYDLRKKQEKNQTKTKNKKPNKN